MSMYDQSDYETTIDLKNLVGHLLIKWKKLLLFAVMTAVMGGVVGLSKSGTSEQETADDGATAGKIERGLSEEQKTEAEGYYSQIVAYDKAIDEQRSFNDDSYIMSLDPEKSIECTILYLIDTELDDISTVYSSSILSDADYDNIAGILGKEVGKKGLNDAILFETETLDSDNSEIKENKNQRSAGKSVVKISILAPNKDTCDKIVEIVDEANIRETEILKDKGIVKKCEMINRIYNRNIENRIMLLKQKNIGMLDTLLTKRLNYINNVVSKIDGKEKEYIDELRGIQSLESGLSSQNDKISQIVIFKYSFAGFLVGLLISVLFYIILYICRDIFRTEEELISGLRIPVLQTIETEEFEKASLNCDIITRWGQSLSGAIGEAEETREILAVELCKKAEKEDIKQIYLAFDTLEGSANRIVENISEIGDGKIEFVKGRISLNAEDMKRLLASEAMVLFPYLDITKIRDIRVLLNVCTRNNIRIIGATPIRDAVIM